MNRGFEIRKLPLSSIKEDEHGMFYIEGGTFQHIPIDLPVRPRAFEFVKWSGWRWGTQLYVCLHADEKAIRALFFIIKKPGKQFEVCRCIGRTATSRHYKRVMAELKEINKTSFSMECFQDAFFFNGYYTMQ